MRFLLVSKQCLGSGSDQYGRQAPDLQLLGGGLRGAAGGAVVALLEALAGREGAQARRQVHGARRRRAARAHRPVLHPRLHTLHRITQPYLNLRQK